MPPATASVPLVVHMTSKHNVKPNHLRYRKRPACGSQDKF